MEEEAQSPKTDGIVTSNRPRRFVFRRAQLKYVLIVVLAGLIIAGVWWLFSSGRLVYVSSKSSDVACGSDIVTQYNGAMFYRPRNGSNIPSLDEAGLKNLVTEIKGKTKYATDPTCQTILFWIAVHDNNYNAANDAYKAVKSLHDKGEFADSNLRSNDSLFTYQGYLNSLPGSGVTQAKGSIGG